MRVIVPDFNLGLTSRTARNRVFFIWPTEPYYYLSLAHPFGKEIPVIGSESMGSDSIVFSKIDDREIDKDAAYVISPL